MGEITLFHLAKQNTAIPQKGTVHEMSCSSTGQQALCAFVVTMTACAPAGAGKAPCLSHPHDHSDLTAEANEAHSWGWDAFACFSNGESPTGFFTQVLGTVHSRKLVFQVKISYWKILSRGHFQKHNVHCRQETELWAKSSEHQSPSWGLILSLLRSNFPLFPLLLLPWHGPLTCLFSEIFCLSVMSICLLSSTRC